MEPNILKITNVKHLWNKKVLAQYTRKCRESPCISEGFVAYHRIHSSYFKLKGIFKIWYPMGIIIIERLSSELNFQEHLLKAHYRTELLALPQSGNHGIRNQLLTADSTHIYPPSTAAKWRNCALPLDTHEARGLTLRILSQLLQKN